MRLNFAGVPDQDIREGVRRIGRVMGGQAGLFGVLTGSLPGRPVTQPGADPVADDPAPEQAAPGLADVLELPRRPEQGRAGRRSAGKQRDR